MVCLPPVTMSSSAKLFVGRLPSDIREDELRNLFSKYGNISQLALKRNYAFLSFSEDASGQEAIRSLDGYTMGTDRIVVEPCKGPGPYSRDLGQDERECFKCKKVGHVARFCPDGGNDRFDDRRNSREYGRDVRRDDRGYPSRNDSRRDGPPGSYERRPISCFNCKKVGHKSYECSEPRNERARSRSPVPRDNYRPNYRERDDRRGGNYDRRDERREYQPRRDDRRDERREDRGRGEERIDKPVQRELSPTGWSTVPAGKDVDRVDSPQAEQAQN
eukprot:NODE_203_length_14950_cov_0.414450.p7 type:complete len:275 gc:universal NODE_203_length_14950_cov_0.414450:14114-13290(-)